MSTALSLAEERTRRVVETMKRNLGQYVGLLTEPDTLELMLNPDGRVWIDRLGSGMGPVGTMRPEAAETLIGTVASTLNSTVTRENPILECELPDAPPFDGARFEALIPPVVPSPTFSIRCRAGRLIPLSEYVKSGIMTQRQREHIEQACRDRRNIIVAGGTTTGKTTLANAILAYIAECSPAHRLAILQDTYELQRTSENVVMLRSTDTIGMQPLLRAIMRLRPDRIIIGEVRGGEALTLLKAWNTGHDGGLGTLHANSAAAGLSRLEQLIQEVSFAPMRPLIAEAVNLVISIGLISEPPFRRVREVIAVTGLTSQNDYILQTLE